MLILGAPLSPDKTLLAPVRPGRAGRPNLVLDRRSVRERVRDAPRVGERGLEGLWPSPAVQTVVAAMLVQHEEDSVVMGTK